MPSHKKAWVVVTKVTGKPAEATICTVPPHLNLVNGGWVTGTPIQGDTQSIDWPIHVVEAIYEAKLS